MEEREILERFVKRIDEIIQYKKERKEDVEEEWSENKYNFMKKYGHI